MAYIKKKSERKFKITVCNGYKVNGQKRMKAQTIYTTRCAASYRRLWTRDTLLTIPHGDVTNRKDKRKSAR